jgi:hypothetical protein
MSAATIKLDNLLDEIKYATHAGDLTRAQGLVVELQVLLAEMVVGG